MTICLPDDIERSIEASIQMGRFASADEAIAAAWRAYQRQGPPRADANEDKASPDPVLGSLRDAADELDEVVADAMKQRRLETWREVSVE